jgi:hypothetical protein
VPIPWPLSLEREVRCRRHCPPGNATSATYLIRSCAHLAA